MGLEQLAAAQHALIVDDAREVLGVGEREFGLGAVEFEHARDRRDVREGLIERALTDAAAERLGAKPGQPGGEIGFGGTGRGRAKVDDARESKQRRNNSVNPGTHRTAPLLPHRVPVAQAAAVYGAGNNASVRRMIR